MALLAKAVGTVIMTSISTGYRAANMKRNAFKSLLSSLDSLTYNQRKKLLDQLTYNPELESVKLIENRVQQTKSCPHCGAVELQRWGKSHDLQRYRCQTCHKTFNALTHCSLSRLRYKEKWLQYSQCLLEGHSIRKAARICGIDPKTAFRWRHRFLAASTQAPTRKMTGIIGPSLPRTARETSG